MNPDSPVGQRFSKGRKPDLLLLTAFCRVICKNTMIENVNLSVREDAHRGEKGAPRILERVRQEATEDKPRCDCESTHDDEEPKPARSIRGTAHVKYTVRQEFGGGLAELVAKVEDHDSLRSLSLRIPSRQGPQTSGNKPRFCDAQKKSSRYERSIIGLEGLEGADCTEEEELQSEPFAWSNPVQNHVRRNLKQHNPERQHLLPDVELVLCDADVFHETVCDRIRNVAAIQLQTEEAKSQDGHDDQV